MNLAQFFDPDLIDVNLKVSTKAQAVQALAEMFCRKFPDKDRNAILRAVSEREGLGSTSLGRGFAFPHARTDAVTDLRLAFGIIKNGVSDSGPDGVPLKAICLLLTPRNIPKLYLQTLSGLANFARRPGILEQLVNVSSPGQLLRIIENADIDVKRTLTVADIMSDNVVAVRRHDSLKDVANIMFKYRLGGVPVIDENGMLIGDISEGELLRSALPDYHRFLSNPDDIRPTELFEDLFREEEKISVDHVMNQRVAAVSETASVGQAAALMLANNVDRVMVVKNGRLIGIVSRSDIISKIIRG